MVDDSALSQALLKRKQFILENLETVTLKKLRATLECDLQLNKDALKPHKNIIAEYVDNLMASQENETNKGDSQISDSSSDEENVEHAKKNKGKPKAAAVKSGPRTYSKRAEKMRSICRQSGITIGPSVYMKNKTDGELEAALLARLEKYGLGEYSGPGEIAKAKQRIQLERDLEGIDTSNIISVERAGRRAAPINFKAILQVDDDDDDELELSQSDDSAGVSSDPSSAENVEDDNENVSNSPLKANAAIAKVAAASKQQERAPMAELTDSNMVPKAKKQRVVDWSDDDE